MEPGEQDNPLEDTISAQEVLELLERIVELLVRLEEVE